MLGLKLNHISKRGYRTIYETVLSTRPYEVNAMAAYSSYDDFFHVAFYPISLSRIIFWYHSDIKPITLAFFQRSNKFLSINHTLKGKKTPAQLILFIPTNSFTKMSHWIEIDRKLFIWKWQYTIVVCMSEITRISLCNEIDYARFDTLCSNQAC